MINVTYFLAAEGLATVYNCNVFIAIYGVWCKFRLFYHVHSSLLMIFTFVIVLLSLSINSSNKEAVAVVLMVLNIFSIGWWSIFATGR